MKKIFTLAILIVVLLLLEVSVSRAATYYYVRPATGDCNYNGDGTTQNCASGIGEAGAWKGFSNVIWGGSGVGAGDTLYLGGGKTYLSEMLSIRASGSSGLPIIISVYGEGQAVVDGQNSIQFLIRGNGNDYITIDGVRGAAIDGNYDYGIKLQNPSDNGICVYDYSGPQNWLITRIECYGESLIGSDYHGGIYMGGGANIIEVSYSWIHGPIKSYSERSQQWHGTGMKIWNTPNGTNFIGVKLHHNKVEYMYHDGIATGSNSSIYNNYVKYVHGSGHSDSILIQSGSYAKIYNNYIESNDQNIYLDNLLSSTQQYIYIFNNVSYAWNGYGVVPHAEVGDWQYLYIFNNTFYDQSNSGASIRQGSGGKHLYNTYIKNNYFGPSSNGFYRVNISNSNDIFDMDYNCYSSTGYSYPDLINIASTAYTLNELKQLLNFENNGLVGTPTFADIINRDFRPISSDTMLINAGVDLSSFLDVNGDVLFTTDKNGIIRTNWDIGAYEYIASGPLPDTTPPSTPMGLTVQ